MTTANILSQLGSPGVSTGFKNRIINGAMVIDQRNAGASVTISNTGAITYTLDRWAGYGNVASKFSVQQNAGSVTPPIGFTNYLGCTSLSAYTVTTNDNFAIQQPIEGYNLADLGWGTVNAKTVTVSAWVYSSLTGTFGGSFRNSAANRCYPFSYSIPVANTWTQISVTVVGDTTGTWLTTNGVGAVLFFSLGAGTAYSGASGAWAGSNYISATGATSVVGTNGATFYITGVQLEVGTTATNFDYRSYGTELALCQRYYQGTTYSSALCYDAGGLQWAMPTKVTMRSSPTVTFTSGGILNNIRKTTNGTPSSASSAIIYSVDTSGSQFFYAASGWSPALTTGQSYDFGCTFSAEL